MIPKVNRFQKTTDSKSNRFQKTTDSKTNIFQKTTDFKKQPISKQQISKNNRYQKTRDSKNKRFQNPVSLILKVGNLRKFISIKISSNLKRSSGKSGSAHFC